MQELKIDQEFKELIPPMSSEEYRQLHDNIVRDGCRDSISTWDGVVLDGYTRYRICQEENIPFETVEIRLSDREEAKKWIIMNQLGKRNLRPGQISMLRGMLYKTQKGKKGGDTRSGRKKGSKNVAKDIADQTGVSERTILKDAELVDAVDKVSEVDPDIKNKVLAGEVSKQSVMDASKDMDKEKDLDASDDKKPNLLDLTQNDLSQEAFENIKKAIDESISMFKKAFIKEVLTVLNHHDRQSAEIAVDSFIMKVEKFKEMLQK